MRLRRDTPDAPVATGGRSVAEDRERPAMQNFAPCWRQRFQDRLPGEFVAKCQQVRLFGQHATSETLVDWRRIAEFHICQRGRVDSRADNRGGLEQLLRGRRKARGACQHRIAHRWRHRDALVGKDFGDKERVAGRATMELARVDDALANHRPDGLLG